MLSIKHLSECTWAIPMLAGQLFSQWNRIMTFEGLDEESVVWELFSRTANESLPMGLVALINGKPVGTASLIPDDMEGGRMSRSIHILTPWLADLFVIPEYRGKGIGSALINRIESEAGRLGYGMIYLYTEDCTSLYDSLGWVVREITRYADLDVTVMEKKIT